jgi:putative glycosyltransferase (TIGR04372 family)
MINNIYKTSVKFFPISVSVIKHIIRWLIWSEYRTNNSVISPSSVFYLRHSRKVIFILYPFLYLIKKYCQKNKIYISVNNIPFAVGHLYPEIDQLLRVLMSVKKYEKALFLYIYPKNKILKEASPIFGRKNFRIIQSGLLHIFFYFAAIKFKEIRIDCSLSVHAHHKTNGLDQHRYVFEDKFGRYADLYRKSSTYYPLSRLGIKNKMPDNLSKLIGIGKYAVIQIKDHAANATWKGVDPCTYEPIILRLMNMGYNVIFAGREKMPEIYKNLGVVNYSESIIATALNDYYLVFNASLVVSSASGFSLMADLLDKPLLLLNIWQLSNCIGRRTLFIPTVILKNKEKLNFIEQYRLFIDLDGVNSKGLAGNTKEAYTALDANAEEIEAALIELIKELSLKCVPPRSALQLDYNSLFLGTWTSNGLSRISQNFLDRNIELMTYD